MKSIKLFVLFAITSLLLAGCANVAYIEKDENINFNQLKSYSWVDSKDEEADSSKKVISLTEQNVRKAVNAELAKQGWREVKNKPEVLLSYDVLVDRSVKENNNPVYSRPFTRVVYNPYAGRWVPIYYPSQFMGYARDQQQVREGTVTITMVDVKSSKTIWQGWTTGEVNSKNMTAREIQTSVRNIFRKFDTAKR
ncbi:MAG TPA: DUF4136 domain-containing protein [Chitinophagaceae bacterium]|jgi:hypothetical protein|nr:DUF4136 domain-containing protein [Chitinophagaceae bacterium]